MIVAIDAGDVILVEQFRVPLGRACLELPAGLVGDETGEPLGPLNAFLRDLVHVVDGFAYVGFLWPLWDERKQTFADKIIKSVVVSEPRTPKAR